MGRHVLTDAAWAWVSRFCRRRECVKGRKRHILVDTLGLLVASCPSGMTTGLLVEHAM